MTLARRVYERECVPDCDNYTGHLSVVPVADAYPSDREAALFKSFDKGGPADKAGRPSGAQLGQQTVDSCCSGHACEPFAGDLWAIPGEKCEFLSLAEVVRVDVNRAKVAERRGPIITSL